MNIDNMIIKGIILLLLSGLGWSIIGIIISNCAHKNRNIAVVQGGAALLIMVFGIFFLIIQGKSPIYSQETILIYLVMFITGIINFFNFILMRKAMKKGPNGIVWCIMQSALIFPFLTGILFFGVIPTVARIIGVFLIIIGIILTGLGKGHQKSQKNLLQNNKWIWAALSAFTIVGISQCFGNLPSYMDGASQVDGVQRAIAFQGGTFSAFLFFSLLNTNFRKFEGVGKPMLALTVVTLIIQFFLFYKGLDIVQQAGAGSIGYPITISSCIIIFFIYSFIFLKETLPRSGMAGIILCICGIIAISL